MAEEELQKERSTVSVKTLIGDPPSIWDTEGKIYEIDKRLTVLERDVDALSDELEKINDNISKLVWIIISAVIIAGLNLIINSGTV